MTARFDFTSRVSLPMIPWFLVLLIGLLCAAPLAAQTPFALTNVGQKVDTEDARMIGRGGWGMAVYDSTNPGFKNTAGLSAVRQVTISLVGFGTGATSKDPNGERTVNRVMAPDLRLAVPVIKGRLALTAGFSMDRSFRYETETEFTDDAHGDEISGVEQFLRRGSLFSVPLGMAWEPVSGLSIGATLGLVKRTWICVSSAMVSKIPLRICSSAMAVNSDLRVEYDSSAFISVAVCISASVITCLIRSLCILS